MSTPRSARDDLGALVEDDLDLARVLAVLGGELERPLAGLHVARGRRSRPSALETTLWATTSTSPAPQVRRRRP